MRLEVRKPAFAVGRQEIFVVLILVEVVDLKNGLEIHSGGKPKGFTNIMGVGSKENQE